MRNVCSALAFAVLGTLASAAVADMQVRMLANNSDRDPSFNGGAFVAQSVGSTPLPAVDADEFRTFCIESNEYFTPGNTFYIEISTAAMFGGSGGGNPDPLDARTAYLYTMYRTDPAALNSYLTGGASFTSGSIGNVQQATRQLQQAIWEIEDESVGVANGLVTHANAAIHNAALWAYGPDSIGNVRVMQLWRHATRRDWAARAQDQLMLLPVPAPAAVGLGAIGLAAVACVRRRQLA